MSKPRKKASSTAKAKESKALKQVRKTGKNKDGTPSKYERKKAAPAKKPAEKKTKAPATKTATPKAMAKKLAAMTEALECIRGPNKEAQAVQVLKEHMATLQALGKHSDKVSDKDKKAIKKLFDKVIKPILDTKADEAPAEKKTAKKAATKKAEPKAAKLGAAANRHALALEATLPNAKTFKAAFEALKGDKSITREELVALSSKFHNRLPPSATKARALKNIMNRHEKLLESRAASSTIGARRRGDAGSHVAA